MSGSSTQYSLASLLLFSLLLATTSSQAGELTHLHVRPAPSASSAFPGWSQQAPFMRKQKVELELDEELEGAILALSTNADRDAHRVSMQFETSMAISDEGPHIDLLDWKHCVSEWKVLPRTQGDDSYTLLGPTEAEASCFPSFTPQEIEAALLAELQNYSFEEVRVQRWLELARTVSAPGDGPMYVGVSKARLRVEEYVDDQWIEVTTVEFTLPLGC